MEQKFSFKDFLLTTSGKVAWLACKCRNQGTYYNCGLKRCFKPDLVELLKYMIKVRKWLLKNKRNSQ